jgi:hypothetical protein
MSVPYARRQRARHSTRPCASRAMRLSEVVIFSGFGGEFAVDRRGWGCGRGTLRAVLEMCGSIDSVIDVGELSARDLRD